ncbi:MAG: alpha/beta hydrolase-fold protein [Bryobacteraceae bacterium]
MRKFYLLAGVFLAGTLAFGAQAIVLDRTHRSQVFHETRNYRIFLPPDYAASGKRYPVIYWFHGYSERYNKCIPGRNYDQGTDYGGDNIANFVGAHDVIVVKWDGYNPRTPGENYLRPYNISPVETDRQFPLYFPELVQYIDAHYRTAPDREHRATAGLSMGGFMSYWVSGKYPSMVSSASNFMGSSEFFVGPRAFPVEYRHTEMHGNYEGLRTRIVMGTQDFIQFYHRRMNLIWDFTRPHHESEIFESEHGTPGMAKTLAFHMRAFADPLPRPEVWNHIDVYPEFSVWGWNVQTNRTRPGLTILANVSKTGFRSSVREWVPAGRVLADVRVAVTSAPLYRPGSRQLVTTIRLRDGAAHRERLASIQKAVCISL